MKITPITVLVILDGFGISKNREYNAILQADTPNLDLLLNNYPHATLKASGQSVGLLPNTMGNSECGHQTIGAGRTILQPISKLNNKIEKHELSQDKNLIKLLDKLKTNNGRLHIMGLLSDGGVHAHEKHAHALLKLAAQQGIKEIYLHPFLDGRDSSPQSAEIYINRLNNIIDEIGTGVISSITGRSYAMDRINNWQKTEKTYNMLTSKKTTLFKTASEAIKYFYTQNIYDEFIPPTPLAKHQPIENNDGVIFFNTRPERAVQLTAAFCDKKFNHFQIKNLTLSFFITGINDPQLKSDYALVEQTKIKNTLFDVLEKYNKSIFTIAETEKFAHVTYFFNSQHIKRENETRIAIESLNLANYKDHPQMSAKQITDTVITSLQTNPCDFYLINYANADMVAHSGDMPATIKAVEFIDKQLGILKKEIIDKQNGTLYITADHGNAECMWDTKTQQPHTRHTTNLVPFIMIDNKRDKTKKLDLHTLADIAPFILKNMGMPIPKEMSS